MKNYYFTFGQGHSTIEDVPMKDYYVRVISDTYENARLLFIQEFTSIYMENLDKWSFQYEEDEFNPESFPGGEYLVIETSSNKKQHK